MQFSSMSSVSPSFTSHSSNNLADIAARVVEEFRNENGHGEDDDIYDNQFYDPPDAEPDCDFMGKLTENGEESDEDKEFEFAVVCTHFNSSPVSADQNFPILPRYPLFDRSLLNDVVSDESVANLESSPVVRHSLRKLFNEERDSASCSSSEADDLDGVTPGTYCIWKPKVESPERCKKSNSTGNTSKRWKLRNLLHRINSDSNFAARKDASVVDFSPVTATKNTAKVAGADDDGEPVPVTDKK